VTIKHESAPVVTVTSTANIAEEDEITSAQGGFVIPGKELQPLTNVVVATFTGDGSDPASHFHATIDWGDGTTSPGVIKGPDQNGVFTVCGTHTYAEDGEVEVDLVDAFPLTITITDGTSVTVTSTANIAEESEITSAQGGFVIPGKELQPLTNVVVATFTGDGSDPASHFHATIDWGDGTTSPGVIKGPDQNGVFTVCGTHTYAEDGEVEVDLVDAFPLTITITDGTSVTVTSTANIAEESEITSAQGGFVIPGKELQALTNVVVATFTGDGSDPASHFHATIDWGDGTTSPGVIKGPDQNGVFTVCGTHTYAEDGEVEVDLVDAFPLTITITDGTSVTVTSTANIAEEDEITNAQGGFIIPGKELQPLTNVVVATFKGDGSDPASHFHATIDWGDGTTSPGVIKGPDQNGVFTVCGTHTYAEDGEVEVDLVDAFPLTVTITDGTSVTVTSTANIAEEDEILSAQGVVFNGQELQALSVTVATFTAQSGETAGDFTASINWGDGAITTGTIVGPDQNGVFTVIGNHTYAEEGEVEQDSVDVFPMTVTISSHTNSVTVSSTANIAEEIEPAVNPSGGMTINGLPGQPITNVTVATFTAPGSTNGNPTDFTAAINWGSGPSSGATISGPDKKGVFTVAGTHTYMGQGTFSVSVTIKHERSLPAMATSTAQVANPPVGGPILATSQPFVALQFAAQDHIVAQFIDVFAAAQVGDFKALINWGDGPQVDKGTITQPGPRGGPFFVDATHTYNVAGIFTVSVLITDPSGATALALSPATVTAKGGGGNAQVPGKQPPDALLQGIEPPLGMNGVSGPTGQTTERAGNPPNGEEWAALLATASASAIKPSQRNDAYWELLHQQPGDRITDPSDWASYELAAAVVSQ
jgi:hypothetical protein